MAAPTTTKQRTPTRAQERAPARVPHSARRTGYLATVVVDLALIWLLHVTPGWERLTFLSPEFAAVTGLITASLVAGALVNLLYVVADPPWVKRLGDAATAALACAVLAWMSAMFPFDLAGRWTGWDTTLRGALGFLTVATAIAVIANLAELLRLAAGGAPPPDRASAGATAGREHRT